MNAGRIAVIGAGLAGMSCAHELVLAGLDVQVFEKSRGIGGRLAQRRLDDARFDLGAQYCTARDPAFVAQLEHWAEHGLARPWPARLGTWRSAALAPLDDAQTRWVGVPSMSAMAKALSAGVPVQTGVRVTPLQGRAAPWSLQDDQGTALGEFAAVVCTAPPAQSAELLAICPAAVQLANAVPLAPCFALAVQLHGDAPECPYDGIFADGQVLSWLARDHSKPGRDSSCTWMLHAAPQWSADWLERPAIDVEQQMLGAFFRQSGVFPQQPRQTSLHRWRYAQAIEPRTQGGWFHPELGLAMAGDWLGGNRVEGAWASGRWAAHQLLASF